jgi:hypothetical protein
MADEAKGSTRTRLTPGHFKELVYVARKNFMEGIVAAKVPLPQQLQELLKQEQEAVAHYQNALKRQQAAQEKAARTI